MFGTSVQKYKILYDVQNIFFIYISYIWLKTLIKKNNFNSIVLDTSQNAFSAESKHTKT